MPIHSETLERKLREKMIVRDVGCWDWIASKDRTGYGVVRRDGVLRRAHRYMYEREVGPIPEGLFLDHLCANRACVRPDHLEPVTMAENFARGIDAAANKRALTHCKHGHPFEGHNLILRPEGGRKCRECMNQAQRRYQARKALG